ncbi:hypothetical protein TTHERM_00058310 (macronuclear) [Tetrahymena thermophila SB210]|uniref:PARP catalytic domain-containing protein n=1 Tax=Tetrahymena thermophila (strain SB210) TaxID=312017 RepID=I7M0C6_TETTS|nr:hypothetical protein TTHERM_00058310 [Tetrahymena thermophila SB210]EAR87319.1 hypothetical protein TTHERM_00058310 [Tetrahymena thermophila SB210]|eukprot:XP_001007564.1 hypothetical protein TTHERM_00058310 [Tetrahymena thermophila SB210]
MGCCKSSDNRTQEDFESKKPQKHSENLQNNKQYSEQEPKEKVSEKKTQADFSDQKFNNNESQNALALYNNDNEASNTRIMLYQNKNQQILAAQYSNQYQRIQYLQSTYKTNTFSDSQVELQQNQEDDSENNQDHNMSMLRISMIGHKSNSDNTKIVLYQKMIQLNFDKDKMQMILSQNISIGNINSQNIQYSQQFYQYRMYSYFKQKESKENALKTKQQAVSDQVERMMKEKIQKNRSSFDLCFQEIALLALKAYYQKQQTNLLFESPDRDNNILNNMDDDDDDSFSEEDEDYEDIQRHFTQIGFNLETYYQLNLNNNQIGWNCQQIKNNEKGFIDFLRQQILKKYKNLKEDDIIILSITDGKVVDFICPIQLENIQVGNQIFRQVTKKSIVKELKLKLKYFDHKYNQKWQTTNLKCYRGKINNNKQEYHLPFDYYGLGLRVLDKYPQDGWINSDTSDSTWIVLFHSTRPESLQPILENGFKEGQGQRYEKSLCRFGRGKVGKGVYFSDNIKNCEKFGSQISVCGKDYQLVFQCRVNPKTVKSPSDKQSYYVVNEPKDIRPYRILIKEKK